MKTYVYTLQLKDDAETIRLYKEHHRAVWPEVEESLRSVGVLRMRICLLGTRLVNIMDTVDEFEPERDFNRYTLYHPQAARWDQMMAEFQERVPEARDGEWWALMEQVYELEGPADSK